MGVSENSVPLNPMVNDHYPYWMAIIGIYPIFRQTHINHQIHHKSIPSKHFSPSIFAQLEPGGLCNLPPEFPSLPYFNSQDLLANHRCQCLGHVQNMSKTCPKHWIVGCVALCFFAMAEPQFWNKMKLDGSTSLNHHVLVWFLQQRSQWTRSAHVAQSLRCWMMLNQRWWYVLE